MAKQVILRKRSLHGARIVTEAFVQDVLAGRPGEIIFQGVQRTIRPISGDGDRALPRQGSNTERVCPADRVRQRVDKLPQKVQPGRSTAPGHEADHLFVLYAPLLHGRLLAPQHPKFQQRGRLSSQSFKGQTLLLLPPSRHRIHHGDRPDRIAIRRDDRHPAIKSDVWVGRDQYVGREPRIVLRILHHQRFPAFNDMGTESGRAGGLGNFQPNGSFEPLTIPVDEGDDGDRSTTHRRSQMRQVIEGDVGERVQNPVARQRGYAGNFVGRRGGRRHTYSPTREQSRALGVPISPRVLPQMPRIE